MTARRWGWCVGLVVVILALGHQGGWGETPPANGSRPILARRIETAVPRGAGSCSATACHGSNVPSRGDILRNEHTTWISKDPHAEAYQTLFSGRSRAIVRNFSGGGVPAHKESRCLACHATSTPDPSLAEVLHQDGVSCESCHGPSQNWIGPHTRYDWSSKSEFDKQQQFGMVPLSNLARRAEACAGCHVGSPATGGVPRRDVDHDLIAAGHPRLIFEFSAYLAMMPPHWNEKGINAGGDFSARCWAVGQAVSARAALALLEDRGRRAEVGNGREESASSPWPEFTEYGCFSCHHDLRDQPWRRKDPRPGSLLGSPRWGSWYYALMPILDRAQGVEDKGLINEFGRIDLLMRRPQVDPRTASEGARVAGKAVESLVERLAGARFTAEQVDELLAAMKALEASGEVESWDHATQRYLSLVALQQSSDSIRNRRDPDARRELVKLRAYLQFPAKYDSPRNFEPNPGPTKPR